MNQNELLNNTEISVISESWFGIMARKKRDLLLGQDSSHPRRLIAIFGGADVREDSIIWKKCFRLGKELALRGAIVVNGGYSGVMAASAAGARSVGGHTIGVTCDNLPEKETNPHIVDEWALQRWDQRLLTMVWLSDGYAVMPGSSGTLVELSMVIETQLKGFIPARPVVCLGSHWKRVVIRIDGTYSMVQFESSPIRCAELLMS